MNIFIKKALMLTRERFGMNPVAVSERYRTLGVRCDLGCDMTSNLILSILAIPFIIHKSVKIDLKRSLIFLQEYIWDPEFLREGQPPNDRGCRACGKIGHIVKDCPRKNNDRRRKDSERERQAEASKGVAQTVKAAKAANVATPDKRAEEAAAVKPAAAAAAAAAKPATPAGNQPNLTPAAAADAAAAMSRSRLKRLVRNVRRDQDLLNTVMRYAAAVNSPAKRKPKPGGGGEGGAGMGDGKAKAKNKTRRGRRRSERETPVVPTANAKAKSQGQRQRGEAAGRRRGCEEPEQAATTKRPNQQ